jgi:NitT/TauT family transport system ATP-binding protein
VHGVPRKTAEQRAEEALDSVGLAGRGRQYPWEVSGGMQQRVAIARGLAYEPKILVMDEPFASVDAQTRLELEELVHSLHRDRNMTMLFVTHDIDEAVFLSDRVIVLGGPPATVVDEVHINLEKPRNQITTRSDPDFGIARTRILQSIYKTRQAPRA